MGPPKQIFVFGDQTNASDANLRQLLHVKDNSQLCSFFDRVNYALKREISRLPVVQQAWFPRYTSLLELLTARRDESGTNPALGLALLCINQLGHFIRYFSGGFRRYPHASCSYAIGLCAGSFAAAAISTSQTIAELLPAAIEAVLVAFRTGLRSLEARNDIEPRSDGAVVWSMTGFSQSQKPYISAIGPTSVTISGPPRVLQQMLKSEHFSTVRSTPLSINSPYHAPDIFTSGDVANILASCDQGILESYKSQFPLYSSAEGQPVSGSCYRSLLEIVLNDVLTHQLRWDKVLKEIPTIFHQASPSQITIYSMLTSTASTLASRLAESTESEVIKTDISTESGRDGPTLPRANPSGNPQRSKIAIVGYGGRFPDAENIEKFWDVLHEGLDVHRKIPADRFDVSNHFDPTGAKKNTSKVQYGCFIKQPGLFDTRFFNMSPRESSNADPGQRLAITTAYEALEMAGFVPNTTPSTQRNRVGIFYGMTSDDWREVNSGQNIDTYFIPGGNRAFTPGRINYHFKFSGPSFSVDTACSSSFAAIHLACNSLWKGDCDSAIAGGTNVLTNPDNFAGLDRGHFLSPTGNCNTFDDGANGYCRADAVGTVILKRLEDAEADKDPIYGVILGAQTNHSAEAESMTRPHVGAQAAIFKNLLDVANVDPLDVSYIEMHGTGTQAGDAVEMNSVLEVFAPGKRGLEHPLHLGSVKANVGHAESGSGVTSLIKVLKMMQENEIPPHCGIKTKINHNFPTDLKDRNVNIALKPTSWMRPEHDMQKRRVFLNNFSAAGGNTAFIMEDAPKIFPMDHLDTRSAHVVAISAKSKLSLQKNVEALLDFITNSNAPLPSLSYTSTARRMHHNYRVMVSGIDISAVQAALRRLESGENLPQLPVPAKVPNVNFAFTGQGALYIGLGRQLFDQVSSFRASLARYDRLAQSQGFPSFLQLIDGSIDSLDLVGPVVSQIGTTCIQMSLAQLWISWGVSPSTVIGHSLGEYAALHIAGVLSASDAIFLVGTRARLLEERCKVGSHAMLAVKASLPSLNSFMSQSHCEVACINGPNETVLSGTVPDIESISRDFDAQNIKSKKLDVPFAFHSSQVECIIEDFEAAAKAVVFSEPSIPFISPLLGEVIDEGGKLGPSYLARACRETVNFKEALVVGDETGTIKSGSIWVEIGAHPICSAMIKATLGLETSAIPSLRRDDDTWNVLVGSLSTLYLAGLDINWKEYHRDFNDALRVLQLPSYRWDSKDYWIQYRNDFCLTKGDDPANIPAPEVCTLSTAAVQRVLEREIGDDVSTILIESDLHHPSLLGVVQGHAVNGASLCPSSLYADIALTITDHLLQASEMDTTTTGMNVSGMTVTKPLIATGNGPQLFRASGSADWSARKVEIKLYSVTSEGKKMADHAACIVKLEPIEDWQSNWKRNAYLVQSRIDTLAHGVDDGHSHKIKRGLAYKLFGALVDYGQCYQGMQEVTLNSAQLEATARIEFQTTEKEENHYFSPYWIDSLGHLAGFVMNANDGIDSKQQVFVNHGWDAMRVAKRFSREKTYRNYVRMQNVGGTMYAGNTYIFDGDEIVAIYEGVKVQSIFCASSTFIEPSLTSQQFQGVPRQALDNLLPNAMTRKAAPKAVASGKSSPKANPSPTRQKKATKALPTPTNEESIMTKVLAIIAEEVGLEISELVPSSNFSDMGVDSLLSLNIAGRLQEELALDVDGSFLAECPTVGDCAKALGIKDKSPSTRASTIPSTPDLELSSEVSEDTYTDETSVDDEEPDTIGVIRRTICEEVGIPEEDLTGKVEFAELGMDSLLSLNILGRLRDELGLDLPSDLLVDNNSLDEVGEAIGLKPKAPSPASSGKASQGPSPKQTPTNKSIPTSSSVLLQGNPKTATKTLFLFPDGSGSATSYSPLPRVSPKIAIFGLNCPYMKSPQDMKCSIEAITPRYLQEIRRRQPHGPYYLGGWSAGGICAFDAAQELDRAGERVERLILIDSPFPIGLEKLPPRLYDFFKTAGLFGEGDKPPPAWLLPHFLAFVDSLDLYRAKPFPEGRAPTTHLIWAKDGVCKYPDSPRPEDMEHAPKEMRWLLNNRTDFGANGWDQLLDKGRMRIETMAEANHFTMMRKGERGVELAAFVKRAMA
ncbi:MAG: hypothetical protein Q9220_001589 [cf. Caloplaca sp. 1 TL-2023]